MIEEPSTCLASRAAERLRVRAGQLMERRPLVTETLTFELAWLADPDALRAIDADLRSGLKPKQPVIYAFRVQDPANYEAVRAAYRGRPSKHPSSGKALAYSRLNPPGSHHALYVGSGRDGPGRIAQHLGRIGGHGTFSMRLALWATTLSATVDLSFWAYPVEISNVELETLEQELWQELSPLLGKQSGR